MTLCDDDSIDVQHLQSARLRQPNNVFNPQAGVD